MPDTTHTDPVDMQLEKAGFYDLLIALHEQEHDPDNCFCTTEISGAYKKSIEIVAALIRQAEERENQTRIHLCNNILANSFKSVADMRDFIAMIRDHNEHELAAHEHIEEAAPNHKPEKE